TIALDSPLTPGSVHRASTMTNAAGGKGINVAHAVTLAGKSALAVIPAAENDPFITLVKDINVDISTVEIAENIRTNTRVTKPLGALPSSNARAPRETNQVSRRLTEPTAAAQAVLPWVSRLGL